MKNFKVMNMQVNYIKYRILIDCDKKNNCYKSLQYMDAFKRVKERARYSVKSHEKGYVICDYSFIASELENNGLPTTMKLKRCGMHDFVVE